MNTGRTHFLLLNIGHFFDHLFMLVFATAAALALSQKWNMGYAELIPYATPGFIAFAVFAIPAGWLADRWSREGMMTIFFIGIGVASSLTALAQTPLQIAIGLFWIGVFAAIYHPVGLALVVEGRSQTGMPLAINGIFGNLGVASAVLITGILIDQAGWESAFVWPGMVSVGCGVVYWLLIARTAGQHGAAKVAKSSTSAASWSLDRRLLIRVFTIIFFSTALGGLVFQSTTFSLPKLFDERIGEIAASASSIGWYAFLVFGVAGIGQLIVGHFIDRYPVRYVFMIVAFTQAALFVAMPGLQNWSALAVSIVFMLAVFGQIPINDVLVGRITRSQWRSRVYALRYIVTFSVTAASVPLIAWIYGSWGFDTLFMCLAVIASLILGAVAMLPVTRQVAAQAE